MNFLTCSWLYVKQTCSTQWEMYSRKKDYIGYVIVNIITKLSERFDICGIISYSYNFFFPFKICLIFSPISAHKFSTIIYICARSILSVLSYKSFNLSLHLLHLSDYSLEYLDIYRVFTNLRDTPWREVFERCRIFQHREKEWGGKEVGRSYD